MKTIYYDVFSKVLNKKTRLCAIVPSEESNSEQPRVLYLLHGNGDSCSSWVENSAIEKYAEKYGTAVIMPEMESSYYTDMARGLPFFTYLSQELPQLVKELTGLNPAPKETFAAGISMGGYGALKWALTYPQKFAACATLSGVVDIAERIAILPQHRLNEFRIIFGDSLKVAPENDLYILAQNAAKSESRPRIFSVCGKSDSFCDFNRKFSRFMSTIPFEWEYQEGDGGHSWTFWNQWLLPALDFMLDS